MFKGSVVAETNGGGVRGNPPRDRTRAVHCFGDSFPRVPLPAFAARRGLVIPFFSIPRLRRYFSSFFRFFPIHRRGSWRPGRLHLEGSSPHVSPPRFFPRVLVDRFPPPLDGGGVDRDREGDREWMVVVLGGWGSEGGGVRSLAMWHGFHSHPFRGESRWCFVTSRIPTPSLPPLATLVPRSSQVDQEHKPVEPTPHALVEATDQHDPRVETQDTSTSET